MNVQVQVCGIILILLVLIMYQNQKTADLWNKRVFLVALFTVLISVSMDAISVILIADANENYTMFLQMFCKAYLVTLIGVGYSSFQYISVDLMMSHILKRQTRTGMLAFALIGAVCVMVAPISFSDSSAAIYTYGLSVTLTYVFALFFLAANFVILVRYKKRMNPRRWVAGLSWMLIWILASVIQFCNNKLLLVGYASALGIVILFIKLENPEGYLDRITGHLNEQALQQYMTQHYSEMKKFSLLVIRLDNFHYLNEMFGRNQVELLLQYMGDYFDAREGATVFKHVEWEYSLIFKKQTDMEWASEEIQERFKKEWEIGGMEVKLSPMFIEVPDSSLAHDADELLELIRFFIMENSKESKGRVLVMNQKWIEQKQHQEEIEKEILAAIQEDRITVFYQPIYSTKQRRFTSAEALVRIRRQDGSIMPPAAFIPVAEQNGLILQIGRIVFEKACQLIKDAKLKERGVEYLEINLSVVQCMQEDMASQLIEIMERIGVAPEMINLEITESAAMQSIELLLRNMEVLRKYGVRFSLDDFGTGYSNLNYILELPVDIVKFDRAMTESYFNSKRGKLIMDSVIGMIKAVELKIVSEGVEEQAQLDTLEKKEIDYIQGYYFSKPVCEEEFLIFLAEKGQS